ncbi:MAG: hypothetical protein AB7G48_10705 [Nitrospiraceae bacterium]
MRMSDPRSNTSDRNQTGASSSVEFPLFIGGPLYRLQQRIRVAQPDRRRLGLTALYALFVAWVPMVILSALQGLTIGPTRLESFLMDFEVNVRFLVTMPVLLFAESTCGARLRPIVRQFLDANLVINEARDRFEDLIQDTVRLSHSGRAEITLLGFAYLHTLIAFVYILDFPDSTWRLPVENGRHVLSLAGGWYFLVAFPLYSLLLLRWLWRIALWWRLLWKVSRLELQLSPAHRDGAGGLGFLSESLSAFALFAFATTATTAGGTADFIVYEGDTIAQYQWEIGGLVTFLLLLIAGPLLSFIPRLNEAKESAAFRYGALASRHIQQVDRKWLTGEPAGTDIGLDFRAVAHMGASVAAVREMSTTPLFKDDVLKLLLTALLPFAPLLATLVPMDEVLNLLLKVLV